jgi:pimeloyl-ACP methyl ester carboxylesterase
MGAMIEPDSMWTNEDPRLHLASWGGEGTPLLLCHGMAGNTHWFDTTAPLLTEAFRPVGLDFRGHGESGWRADGHYDTAGWVADIEEARHALGWERMVLCGHSLGGRIALEYAAKHPDRLIGLIAVDFLPEFYASKSRSFAKTRSRSQPHYPDKERMLEKFHLQPPGTLLDRQALIDLAKTAVRKASEGFTWKFDWRAFTYQYGMIWPTLPKIKVPTLIVRGAKSTVMDHAAYERCLKELPGAKGLEIPAAYHHVPLDTPKEMAAAIVDFSQCLLSAK